MKKLSYLFMLCMFVLSGCSDKDENDPGNNGNGEEPEVPDERIEVQVVFGPSMIKNGGKPYVHLGIWSKNGNAGQAVLFVLNEQKYPILTVKGLNSLGTGFECEPGHYYFVVDEIEKENKYKFTTNMDGVKIDENYDMVHFKLDEEGGFIYGDFDDLND